jgi:putative ABC transport system permease protein
MIHLLQDLRFAFRMMRKAPMFSSVAVLVLAIGIGANTAMFSTIEAVLLRPLPYRQPDRLTKVWEQRPTLAKGRVSPADFADWKAQARSFEQLAAYRTNDYNLLNLDEPEQIQGAAISTNLFAVLGVRPEIGREFAEAEETPGRDTFVILSHRLWVRRFAGNPAIIGRGINLDGTSVTVVGIMPATFFFPTDETELWRPLAINPNSSMAGRGMHLLEVIGRLKAGTDLSQAAAEMHTIAARLEAEYPRDNTGHGANVLGLQDDLTGSFRPSLLLLFGAVGLVLLISCANVANLLLVRANGRRREMAIRLALGATPWRIVQQLLTESMLLALLGAGLGLLFARFGIQLLTAWGPAHLPRVLDSHLGSPVLLFTLGVATTTGVLFGLAPAFQISAGSSKEGLAGTSPGSSATASARAMRRLFVVAEIALAALLVIGAGLFIKSFARVRAIEPGFRTDHVLVADLSLPGSRYRTDQRAAFVERVVDELRANPRVRAAGAVTHLPLATNGPTFDFAIEAQPPPPPGEEFKAQLRAATPDYFRAIGIPLMSGRQLQPQDSANALPVVVINDVMAKRYWPRESPIGKRISFDKSPDGSPVWRQIVGVVQGVRTKGLEFEPEAQMYTPLAQFSMPFATLAVQSSTEPAAMTAELRRAVTTIDRGEPVSNVRTMEEVSSESTSPRRASAFLLGLFASVALMLASLGIYGVLSYAVTQRTKEIGIRVALGAQPSHILQLVIGEGMWLTAVGIGLGLAASLAVGRTVAAMLYAVKPSDPLVLGGTAFLLWGVALAACIVPAYRAIRINPVVALRHE